MKDPINPKISASTIRKFAAREWSPFCMWACSGILTAALLHLLATDIPFRKFLASGYTPIRNHFEGPRTYATFILAGLIALALAIAPRIPAMVRRCWRSWWFGVVSGIRFPAFICALVAFTLHGRYVWLVNLGAIAACFLCGYVLYIRALARNQSSLKVEEVQVPDSDLEDAGTAPGDSDDPINSWNEDILERAPLINTICFRLLILKAPLVALFGELGSGKTSVLNLLRSHLKGRAIVVSFSTWLPGSPEALASYLLGDIAQECSRNYIVPGIRKDTRKLASALAKTIPNLNVFSELFSDTTQKEDIEALGDLISRLPQRVVVLLDEVDRMQKEEIIALLKVVRGISESQNLSFVYAFDREIVEKTVTGGFDERSHTYFEKFFPVSVSIPVLDAAMLKEVGIRRLSSALDRINWFDINADKDKFAEKLAELWVSQIAPLCPNLRSVGLLANNVGMAASPLRGEVNPIDLTLIELLRLFEPQVYEIVWRYRDTLTGGEDWLSPTYVHRGTKEKEDRGKRIVEEVSESVPNPERLKAVRTILSGMFVHFSGFDRDGQVLIVPRKRNQKGEEKSISDPSLISAYFRYKLPEDLFSSRSLNSFLHKFEAASDSTKNAGFLSVFNSMQKGDPRRSDFVSKISSKIESVNLRTAESLAHACVLVADRLVYDLMFVSIGEAGHALRILIRTAGRFSGEERIAFLSRCIVDATDDTLAFRIQTLLTKPGQDFDLGVPFAELYPSFSKRMRLRYGKDIDAQAVDLTSSDPQAFRLWGASDLTKEGATVDPEDRPIQRDFWIRYIGDSRSRLAYAFSSFIMPDRYAYSSDPTTVVESAIPVSDLRKLYEELPAQESLSQADLKSLSRLGEFLAGKFKNGISPLGSTPNYEAETVSDEGNDPDS